MADQQVKQLQPLDHEAERLVNASTHAAEREFFRFLGAVGFSEKLTSALAAQNLHALDHVKREKLYLAGGYQTFDDFLDHDPNSPMKAETFRRRWNLLTSEGDDTFNFLNAMKVPFETRKLLAGQVEVKDNEISVGGVGTRLDDGPRIVELISTLHKKTVEQQRTIERKDKKIKQGEKDFEKLKRQRATSDTSPLGQAMLMLAGAFTNLIQACDEASNEEREAIKVSLYSLIAEQNLRVNDVFNLPRPPEMEDLGMTDQEAQDALGE